MEFSRGDLAEAERQVDSALHKLRETIKTFEAKENTARVMNDKVYKYESRIYEAGESGGAYVIFPYDIRLPYAERTVKTILDNL